MRRLQVLTTALVALLLLASAAQAKPRSTSVRTQQGTITTTPMPGTGVERKMLFKYGPVRIHPGQNTISITPTSLRPPKGGWITSFHPNLTYTSGKVPPVDVIHLHHAVWLINRPGDAFRPTWAAGEEKTIFRTPKGFGWHFKTSDQWLLNHMIHNLFPTPTSVYITWEMTFIPDGTPAAKGMKEVKTQWLDVEGGKAYPVFDVLQGTGHGGQYTFPDDNPNAYPDGNRRNRWVVDHDATLVGTAGHLHPGGLWTDLKLTRGDRTVELFRSKAKYWEPAGAVSWDVAMTATPKNWRVAVKNFLFKQGDLSMPGAKGLPPVIPAGQPLTFVNDDAGRDIFHTITACKQPCNGAAGIAFPLANAGSGPLGFDSGELGFGPAAFTAASNRKTWQTPTDLGAGTYTYFCRVHPFMRGSFRVTG